MEKGGQAAAASRRKVADALKEEWQGWFDMLCETAKTLKARGEDGGGDAAATGSSQTNPKETPVASVLEAVHRAETKRRQSASSADGRGCSRSGADRPSMPSPWPSARPAGSESDVRPEGERASDESESDEIGSLGLRGLPRSLALFGKHVGSAQQAAPLTRPRIVN